uniref:Uncharacterized protein n=1 Tax=Cucumis sativus TaxID=3659 RepID=A0A0A0KUP8_CUCSA
MWGNNQRGRGSLSKEQKAISNKDIAEDKVELWLSKSIVEGRGRKRIGEAYGWVLSAKYEDLS